MPKKKTGQRKKKEKQKILQKNIQSGKTKEDFKSNPVNLEMICDHCQRRQKNRFSCYFCSSIQKLLQCAECGRIKCLTGGGDCVVRHVGRHATGLAMMGAICDFCEATVCHSRKCLQTHACSCLLRENDDVVTCVECDRSVWEHGGRAFRCATCSQWLCEDDQFEHQASCQILESEDYKCMSCNRMGIYSCLRCKICFCAEHVRGFTKVKRGEQLPCKKCGYELQETKDLAMSVRKHEYGRRRADEDEGGYSNYRAGTYSDDEVQFPFGRGTNDSDEESEETSSEEDDSESDEENEKGAGGSD